MAYIFEERLTRDECLVLLRGARVGRVGVSVNALPAIVPVNYVVIDDSLIFRCSKTSTLFRASVGSVLAFEIDDYAHDGSFGWSVLVRGFTQEIQDAEELSLARSIWLEAWPLGNRAERYLVIALSVISGRRFVRAA